MTQVKKVPVILQMEALECGAACLCMVLAYHGKWVPLSKVRSDCGVSRDGSSARGVVRAARAHGLQATGYRMEPKALKDADLPAILHWNANHFVVLNGFRRDKAVINDPARATVEVPWEEFDSSFTGIALCFQPSEDFQPLGKPANVLEFAKERLQGARAPFVLMVLLGILSSIVGVVSPVFSQVFMDSILSGKNPEWLSPFVGVLGIAWAFAFVVSAFTSLSWYRIEGRFAVTADASYMWHVLRLPLEFFFQRSVGDIVRRQGENRQIAGTLIRKLAPAFMNVSLLVFYLAIMLRYNALLAAIGVATVLSNIISMRALAQKQVNLARTVQRSGGKLAGATMSGMEMIETIKASGAEGGFFQRWAGYYAAQHNAQVSIARFAQAYGLIPSILQQAASIGILMGGVYLILDGSFTIGMLLAFQGFLASFLSPASQLLDVGQSFISMRSSMERIEDVMRYEPDVGNVGEPSDSEVVFGKLLGRVELKDVTFGYNKLAAPLIQDFSLTLEPGKTVAVVGGSGSGKSTLARLITGLYKPWAGEILFDGRRREEYPSHILKGSLAMVDQEITLFEDTVLDNIRMWDSSIEDFAVILAARDADIHDTVISRPEGYAHTIKEGGRNFSGGERQRLEIARVLAQEPTVIILDEATSALDAKTEEQIMQNIRNLGATCIVIAHRLSTVRECDEIVVLSGGRIVERGTHAQLFAMGGEYANLVASE